MIEICTEEISVMSLVCVCVCVCVFNVQSCVVYLVKIHRTADSWFVYFLVCLLYFNKNEVK